jgi:rhodanese-related sulfurtransferase
MQASELLRRIQSNSAPLPQDKKREMVITCEHGQRAVMAMLLLGLA